MWCCCLHDVVWRHERYPLDHGCAYALRIAGNIRQQMMRYGAVVVMQGRDSVCTGLGEIMTARRVTLDV
ncbi:hypothetical protein BISU_0292 [Bifidobacterium subtile]|uniref:Uncharacterized protein n=1 Tax=Bifidobacterium subtile TaxID=77635 RepID=A0A087E7R5_9BIFI|nr:hypothetical protein BISU_0292 [Bifidobacterium subtile]